MVSKKITGGLKLVSRYQPTLNSDVDQARLIDVGFLRNIPNVSMNHLNSDVDQDTYLVHMKAS